MAIPFFEEDDQLRTFNRTNQTAPSQCVVNIRLFHENVDTSRDRSTDVPKYFFLFLVCAVFAFLVIILCCKMSITVNFNN